MSTNVAYFKSSRGSIRPSTLILLLSLTILLALAFIVYNDWDIAIREKTLYQFLPIHNNPDFTEELQGQMAIFEKVFMWLAYTGIIGIIVVPIINLLNRREFRKRIASLVSEHSRVTADEFLEARRELINCNELSSAEFTGVYVLHNETKNLYYVGQSVRVLQRVNQHLTGHGNSDVYAEFKNGDTFTVMTIPMQGSGYQSLNDLERDTIAAYGAYEHGYNMTRGNAR